MFDLSTKVKKPRVWPLRGKQRKRRLGATKTQIPGGKLSPKGSMTNVQILERLASMAATADEISGFFEISQPTINKRLRNFPQLKSALDQGKAAAQISVRRLLFDRAKQPTSAGVSAALFLGKTLLAWPRNGEDGGVIERPAGGPEKPPEPDRLTIEERARFRALMKKAGDKMGGHS